MEACQGAGCQADGVRRQPPPPPSPSLTTISLLALLICVQGVVVRVTFLCFHGFHSNFSTPSQDVCTTRQGLWRADRCKIVALRASCYDIEDIFYLRFYRICKIITFEVWMLVLC